MVLTAAIPDDAKLYFFKPICHANKYKRRIDTPISVRAHIFLSTGQDKEYTDYANEILTSRINFTECRTMMMQNAKTKFMKLI